MVAAGGVWFIPATRIEAFWAFLLGVCLIAAGLTFLETIANPYTTVLGPPVRGHADQSGPVLQRRGLDVRPIAGAEFFYSVDAAGQSTGAENCGFLISASPSWSPSWLSSSISPTCRISRRKTITISTTAIRTSPTRSGPIRTLYSRSSRSFSMWPLKPASSASSSTT